MIWYVVDLFYWCAASDCCGSLGRCFLFFCYLFHYSSQVHMVFLPRRPPSQLHRTLLKSSNHCHSLHSFSAWLSLVHHYSFFALPYLSLSHFALSPFLWFTFHGPTLLYHPFFALLFTVSICFTILFLNYPITRLMILKKCYTQWNEQQCFHSFLFWVAFWGINIITSQRELQKH